MLSRSTRHVPVVGASQTEAVVRIPDYFKEVRYAGRARGERRTYHVFEGSHAYLVVSPNTRGGLNVNPVSRRAPDLISKRFHGRHVTSKRLAKSGGPFRAAFAPLNALYVMVALGRATKLKIRDGRSMVFSIK
jgi:hypothetical protein